MLSESLTNNNELNQELLEGNYFDDSQRLKNAEIEPETAKEYLKAAIDGETEKASEGLSPLKVTLLEAIIKQAERPAIKVQNNSFETPRTEYWKSRLEPYRATIDTAIESVGRVEVRDHPQGFNYVGTGWLVTDDIIVTNRHVAQTFAFQESGKFAFQTNPLNRPIKVNIDFREEYRISTEEQFDIVDVLYIEPQQGSDIAFLKVKRSGDRSRSIISLTTKIAKEMDEIAVIGYPARDSQRNPIEPAEMAKIFEDIYDVKRLQPGEVISVAGVSEALPVFTHDCSTLGGNSGSVVLDFKTGKAIGLHFGGIFQRENYAVPATIVEQRLNDLLSGKLKIGSIAESPVVVFSGFIDLEAVDNETPIEFDDVPCVYPLDDENLEDLISEAVPFPAVNTQLPISGTGYYSYAQFREKQFGLLETIKAIEEIGKAWFQNHRTGPVIGIGNISKNGGGPVPPHKSHQTGLDVDFRLLRTDGARIGITFRDPNYSLARTQDLINTILNNSVLSVKLILCNDNNLKGVKPWPGHDDHLHVRFSK
jgi:S1-C subfamily serine protease